MILIVELYSYPRFIYDALVDLWLNFNTLQHTIFLVSVLSLLYMDNYLVLQVIDLFAYLVSITIVLKY